MAQWFLNATSANTSGGGAGVVVQYEWIFGSEQSSAINDFAYGVYNGKFTAGSGPSDNSVAGSVTVNNSTTRIHSWTRNNTTGAVNIYANGASEGSMTLNTGSRTTCHPLQLVLIKPFQVIRFFIRVQSVK